MAGWVLRNIFGPNMEEVAKDWRKLQRGGSFMVCVPHQLLLWSNLCWVYGGLKRYVLGNLKDGNHLEDVVGADWIRVAEELTGGCEYGNELYVHVTVHRDNSL
jgi:hypothetical protein